MKKPKMTPLQREELRLTELLIQNLEAQLAKNPNYVRLLECRSMIASLTAIPVNGSNVDQPGVEK